VTEPAVAKRCRRHAEDQLLVTREPDAADSRIRQLRVTAACRQVAYRAITVVEAADRAYFAHVADQRALGRLLKTLAVPPTSARAQEARPDRIVQRGKRRR